MSGLVDRARSLITGSTIRFAAVGVVNTATYYGSYLVLKLIMPYLVAHVVAFILSMIGSYFLNCYFTFRTKPTWKSFLLFPLSTATNFVVQTVGVFVLVEWFGFNKTVSPLLAAAAAIPVTFIVAKAVLIGKHSEARPAATVK